MRRATPFDTSTDRDQELIIAKRKRWLGLKGGKVRRWAQDGRTVTDDNSYRRNSIQRRSRIDGTPAKGVAVSIISEKLFLSLCNRSFSAACKGESIQARVRTHVCEYRKYNNILSRRYVSVIDKLFRYARFYICPGSGNRF